MIHPHKPLKQRFFDGSGDQYAFNAVMCTVHGTGTITWGSLYAIPRAKSLVTFYFDINQGRRLHVIAVHPKLKKIILNIENLKVNNKQLN